MIIFKLYYIYRKEDSDVVVWTDWQGGYLWKAERGICMKKLFNFLISASLVSIFFIPHYFALSSQQTMLLYSVLPILAILAGFNATRFTYREVRHQKFRWISYGLSLVVFIICLLSYFDILPVKYIGPGMSQIQKGAVIVLLGLILLLMVINLIISIGDINRRDKGWPL